jgi:DNA repair exonuclease SbcCD ATPase subunit
MARKAVPLQLQLESSKFVRAPGESGSRSLANSPRGTLASTYLAIRTKLPKGIKTLIANKKEDSRVQGRSLSKPPTSASSQDVSQYQGTSEGDHGDAKRLRQVIRSLEAELNFKDQALKECRASLSSQEWRIQLLSKDAEIKRLSAELELLRKTTTRSQEVSQTVPRESTSRLLKLRCENTKLKRQLEAQSPRKDVLTEVETQLAQLESMQASLMIENRSLKERLQEASQPSDSSIMKLFLEVTQEVTRLRVELSQLNRVMKRLNTDQDFCLNELFQAMMEPVEVEADALPFARCSRELVLLRGEIAALRTGISDNLAERVGQFQCFSSK